MLDYKVSDDRWKEELRKEIVTAITGSPLEKIKAFGQVGYYYKCHAPATIYKYFHDDQRSLEAVKCNKLWYSAPCKFNDVFDCDILIDEKEILNSALRQFPDKRGIRPGSPVWKETQKRIAQGIPLLWSTLDGLKTETGIACLTETEDVMYTGVSMEDLKAFYQSIMLLNESRSVILITNRELSSWSDAAEDKHLIQTLTDRITAHSQIIRLN